MNKHINPFYVKLVSCHAKMKPIQQTNNTKIMLYFALSPIWVLDGTCMYLFGLLVRRCCPDKDLGTSVHHATTLLNIVTLACFLATTCAMSWPQWAKCLRMGYSRILKWFPMRHVLSYVTDADVEPNVFILDVSSPYSVTWKWEDK